MIILASSSPTRAKILTENGINFEQISFEFDESKISKDRAPHIYVQMVVKAKKEQFFKTYLHAKNVLFADSCVACEGKILGKAADENEASDMLWLQSGKVCSVFSAMIFTGENFELLNVSETAYEFDKFSRDDVQSYLESGEWRGKAGAMTIENFNKKYIISQQGETSTAMGFNVKILKAFL
ncbi:septum formation inhibitor Maf [Campylobacter curvus]|uniref:Nucleoside triphosphate pyrophosphatase n=1 Tax=Campylobacter curvus (strain 525.92) TaxID=360105 RepID=A7GZA6_CAMC5|nr:septum formation inhibitor Maf [Campylobacter curvus]EAU00397.1 septum formation protein Maf [Campylobacter curvus 525.92]